jgi:hypothetical protein
MVALSMFTKILRNSQDDTMLEERREEVDCRSLCGLKWDGAQLSRVVDYLSANTFTSFSFCTFGKLSGKFKHLTFKYSDSESSLNIGRCSEMFVKGVMALS